MAASEKFQRPKRAENSRLKQTELFLRRRYLQMPASLFNEPP